MAKKENAFNTVTPLSKTLALILFIAFPFLGFYLGIQYQKMLDKPLMNKNYETSKPVQKPCTLEAKICPDGTTVGRVGPNCEFAKCEGEK